MKRLNNQYGVTLVELLIVIVVLSVIAGISVFSIGNLVENTRVRADQATVLGLNQATHYYRITNPNTLDYFVNDLSNSERISHLKSQGFLTQQVRAQHPDTVYVFDQENTVWCRISCTIITGNIDFTSPDFSVSDFVSKSGTEDYFSVEGNQLVATPPAGSDDILFFENPRSDYTITVDFAIEERISGNNRGGLGVLFETVLNNNDPSRDTGYILQVDRHFSQILVRRRNNGGETNTYPIRYDVVFDHDNVSYIQRMDNTYDSTYRDHSWWEEPHQLILNVRTVGPDKVLTVSIDGTQVFTWTIDNPITPENASLNYTGLRAWWSVPVRFSGLSITD